MKFNNVPKPPRVTNAVVAPLTVKVEPQVVTTQEVEPVKEQVVEPAEKPKITHVASSDSAKPKKADAVQVAVGNFVVVEITEAGTAKVVEINEGDPNNNTLYACLEHDFQTNDIGKPFIASKIIKTLINVEENIYEIDLCNVEFEKPLYSSAVGQDKLEDFLDSEIFEVPANCQLAIPIDMIRSRMAVLKVSNPAADFDLAVKDFVVKHIPGAKDIYIVGPKNSDKYYIDSVATVNTNGNPVIIDCITVEYDV